MAWPDDFNEGSSISGKRKYPSNLLETLLAVSKLTHPLGGPGKD